MWELESAKDQNYYWRKRIIIDDKYYFIDLVFYNRLLHCNVIIELKNDEFKHEDLGQLNAYVGYYKKNEMMAGDNPPVGILLCTDKGWQMVEYALSGMDNQLFVSTYMLHLPDKKKLEEFMLKEMEEMGMSPNSSRLAREEKTMFLLFVIILMYRHIKEKIQENLLFLRIYGVSFWYCWLW